MVAESANDDVWRELGDHLAAIRKQRGMLQQELADTAEVSLSTITRLESGRPLVRRSRSWSRIEKALDLEPKYIERFVSTATRRTGFLIEVSDLSEIEPRAREAITSALMATLPDATVAQVRAAEAAAIRALRENGILPPEE